MIKSESFYNHIYDKVKRQPNIKINKGDVVDVVDQNDVVVVKTKNETFTASRVLNSIPNDSYKTNLKFPVLLQHFVGWTIKTNKPVFDEAKATLMDFSIDQKNETRFIYVLPTSKNEALVEFTLFSKELITTNEYEIEIKKHLQSLAIIDYEVKLKENGIIPMTCFPFDNANTKNVVNIGTAGGWTKPSSGYTFRFADKYSDKLIDFIKSERSFKKFKLRNRFWFYDLLFIDVLYYKNHLGSILFENMFKKNKFKSIFRFLDNESNFTEELKIISSFPKWIFIKSFFKNLPKIISNYL
jgi:lycopene beta-cyclase